MKTTFFLFILFFGPAAGDALHGQSRQPDLYSCLEKARQDLNNREDKIVTGDRSVACLNAIITGPGHVMNREEREAPSVPPVVPPPVGR
ncbi:MAG: hypothetical protein AB2L20_05675 [Mangrovibacterium sp.]